MKSAPSYRIIGSVFALGLMFVTYPLFAKDNAVYPAPTPASDAQNLGQKIQRTMNLLATSTPTKRNHVRVLFYGQSITEQEWSKQVADDLRKRFPNADLEIENRAIGGFASQWLIRPAEHDLYPFYPDLVIFHVYGANQQYEEIIRNIRSRTTAEVLMQKDHITAWPPTIQDANKDKGEWWTDFMNNQFLPQTAQKYGCGLDDVRGSWLEYLKANKAEPKQLLKDGVHLNDWGNYLMAQLVSRYLVYRPELPAPDAKNIKNYIIGKDIKWQGDTLTLDFDGNRVDVLPDAVAIARMPKATQSLKPVTIMLDGKKPTERPDVYAITRPQPGPWSPLFIKRIEHDKPVIAEEWTLKITSVNADSSAWKFDVSGSVTGQDGSGESDKLFVSNSGRVRIDPMDYFRNGAIPVGYEIKWKAYPIATDSYTPPTTLDPSRENATTLAQGIPNAHHILTLTATGDTRRTLRALRVYTPPVK